MSATVETQLFNFITDEEFRHSLESDYSELQRSLSCCAWKAVHVLAGAIVEAVLIDYLLLQGKVAKEEALKLDLGQAISRAESERIISSKARDLSSVIKEYRNLIHPGRSIRLKETVSAETAQVAHGVVRIIVGEIAQRRQENYGLTAEQIVAKLKRDSSAAAIIRHLLQECPAVEVERLLLNRLPVDYLDTWQDPDPPEHLLSAFVICFRAAFDLAEPGLRGRVAKRFVLILKEESDLAVLSHGTAFFRATDLEYLPPEDVTLVKDHLLSRIQDSPSAELIKAMSGIGKYLSPQDTCRFVDGLVRVAVGKAAYAKAGRALLENERVNTTSEIDVKIVKRLEEWERGFNERLRHDGAQVAAEVAQLYQPRYDEDDIPF